MKKILYTYILSILIFLIPFLFISFIIALSSYFIQFNALYIEIIIQILSYILLMISSLFLTSQIKKRRIFHSSLFAFLYFMISLFIHLGKINIIHLLLKPSLFIIIAIYKEITYSHHL